MNGSFLVTIAWVLAISFVGMLPMSYHKRFGFPLLAIFPFVLVYLGWQNGIYWSLALLLAALSIYRHPAKYYGLLLWHKISGKGAAD